MASASTSASQDTTEKSTTRHRSHDDLPMIWDTQSILLTVGFFGGALAMAWAVITVFGWFAGHSNVILLSREEAARMVRERGCKCRKARSTSISGTGRPRKEDYMCACPDQFKHKKTKKQLKKKTVSTQAPVGKSAGKASDSGPKATAIKESL